MSIPFWLSLFLSIAVFIYLLSYCHFSFRNLLRRFSIRRTNTFFFFFYSFFHFFLFYLFFLFFFLYLSFLILFFSLLCFFFLFFLFFLYFIICFSFFPFFFYNFFIPLISYFIFFNFLYQFIWSNVRSLLYSVVQHHAYGLKLLKCH